MKRRDLMVAAGSAAALAACAPKPQAGATRNSDQRFHWKMVTSWPPNFPGLGTSVVRLGEMLEKGSGGRLTIKIYGGNELVPPFEVFDAVSRGTVEMGHCAAYYWKGKHPAKAHLMRTGSDRMTRRGIGLRSRLILIVSLQ